MKDLRASRAVELVQRLVAEGEHVQQDFKLTVNDPRKIARSISAFANNQGGRLLIGVNDNGNLSGVRSEEDIWVVEAAAELYCSPSPHVDFTAYKVRNGATIIRAEITPIDRPPVCVREADGSLRAYFRVADENIVAHPLMVRSWRHAADPSRTTLLDITPERSALLDRLAVGPVTPEDLAMALHLSSAALNSLIADLYALGIITFTYLNHRFHLTLTDR